VFSVYSLLEKQTGHALYEGAHDVYVSMLAETNEYQGRKSLSKSAFRFGWEAVSDQLLKGSVENKLRLSMEISEAKSFHAVEIISQHLFGDSSREKQKLIFQAIGPICQQAWDQRNHPNIFQTSKTKTEKALRALKENS
jgi:hypothetical protein